MRKRNTALGVLNIVAAVSTATVTSLLIVNSVSHLKKNKESNVSK